MVELPTLAIAGNIFPCLIYIKLDPKSLREADLGYVLVSSGLDDKVG
ncbi:hypothetical protein [Thalassoporum mexicanum]|nr:hypothetical protein [Pseudanabaena sp. PCC 7367]